MEKKNQRASSYSVIFPEWHPGNFQLTLKLINFTQTSFTANFFVPLTIERETATSLPVLLMMLIWASLHGVFWDLILARNTQQSFFRHEALQVYELFNVKTKSLASNTHPMR